MDPMTIMMALGATKGLSQSSQPYILGGGGQVVQKQDPFASLDRIAKIAGMGQMASQGVGSIFDKFKKWGQTTPGVTSFEGNGYGGGFTTP